MYDKQLDITFNYLF